MKNPKSPVAGGETSIYEPGAWRRGVFAMYPAMSPKYNTRSGEETMARLLIPVPKSVYAAWEKARSALPNADVDDLAYALGYKSDIKTKERSYNRGYIDFLLQRAEENFQEKFQVSELQGDNYTVFFFGQKAPIFHYTGILLNTMQDDWRKAMTLAYLHLLRGTKLAQFKLSMAIAYDEMVVVGSMVNMGQVFTSDRQIASDFSFSILVKKIQFKEMHSYPTQVRTNIGYIELDKLMSTPVEDVRRNIRAVAPASGRATEQREKKLEESKEEPLVGTDIYNYGDVIVRTPYPDDYLPGAEE